MAMDVRQDYGAMPLENKDRFFSDLTEEERHKFIYETEQRLHFEMNSMGREVVRKLMFLLFYLPLCLSFLDSRTLSLHVTPPLAIKIMILVPVIVCVCGYIALLVQWQQLIRHASYVTGITSDSVDYPDPLKELRELAVWITGKLLGRNKERN